MSRSCVVAPVPRRNPKHQGGQPELSLSATVPVLSSDKEEHNIPIKCLTRNITISFSACIVMAFPKTQQSIGFCYEMRTRAVFQAGMANLFDVSGRVSCVSCCLSLLSHQLGSCLLEAFQGLLLICCQVVLQFYMSLDQKKHAHHTKENTCTHTRREKVRMQTLKLSFINTYCLCE